MKRGVGLVTVSRLIVAVITAFIFFYLIYAMADFGGKNDARSADNVEKIIYKALAQCYALEGGYPADIYYVEKYGVIFDDSRYYYYYEPMDASNMEPLVKVLVKK